MEMAGSQKIDNEIKADPLMDDMQLFDASVSSVVNANDELPELHESAETIRPQRNRRYNMRQSLAWDSSFFTSAGVLDPEELSSMITGADKSGNDLLPGIEEDVSGSTESISTLKSDNFTLEPMEDELFVDIRASIQRSSKRASNLTSSTSNPTVVKVDSTAISSLKKESIDSQNKLMQQDARPSLKKSGGLPSVRMPKFQPKQIIGKPGTERRLKQDSGHPQATQSNAKAGEAKSILPRPTKGTSRPLPTSRAMTKRDSVGTGRVKSEYEKSELAPSKNTQPSKASILTGTRRALLKPAVSSKSSSLGSSITNGQPSTRSSALGDRSTGISSETTAASSLMMARRNPIRSGNVGTTTAALIPKTPSRVALKNKAPSSTRSTHLVSAKTSAIVSPSSSIGEWSSASSSSSMINGRSQDTVSCRSMDGEIVHSELRHHSGDRILNGHKNHETAIPDHNSKRSSTQPGDHRGPSRPTRLRMPSPKIGFFDGVKSSGQTPNASPQPLPCLHAAVPKGRAAASSPTIELKNCKVPTATVISAVVNTDSDSPKAVRPASFQENTFAAVEDAGVQSVFIHPPSLSLEVNGTEEIQHEESKILKGEAMQVAYPCKELNVSCDVGDLNNEKVLNACESMSTGDVKSAPIESNNASVFVQNGDGDEQVQNLKNDPCPILEAHDKENAVIKWLSGHCADLDLDARGDKQGLHLTNDPCPFEADDKENAVVKCEGKILSGCCADMDLNAPGDEQVQNLKNDPCPILDADDKENVVVKCEGEKLSGYSAGIDLNAHGDEQVQNLKNDQHPIIEAANEENDVVKCVSEKLSGQSADMDLNAHADEQVQNLENDPCPILEAADKENVVVKYEGGHGAAIDLNAHGDEQVQNLENGLCPIEDDDKGNAVIKCEGKELSGLGADMDLNVHVDKQVQNLKIDPCPILEADDKENVVVKCEGEKLSGCCADMDLNAHGDEQVQNLKNDPCPILDADDKENVVVKCEGEKLSGYSAGIDLNAHGQEQNLKNYQRPIIEAANKENDVVKCVSERLSGESADMDLNAHADEQVQNLENDPCPILEAADKENVVVKYEGGHCAAIDLNAHGDEQVQNLENGLCPTEADDKGNAVVKCEGKELSGLGADMDLNVHGDEQVQNLKIDPCPILEADDKENAVSKCESERLSGHIADTDLDAASLPLKDSQPAAPRAPLFLKNVFSNIECMDVAEEPTVAQLKGAFSMEELGVL